MNLNTNCIISNLCHYCSTSLSTCDGIYTKKQILESFHQVLILCFIYYITFITIISSLLFCFVMTGLSSIYLRESWRVLILYSFISLKSNRFMWYFSLMLSSGWFSHVHFQFIFHTLFYWTLLFNISISSSILISNIVYYATSHLKNFYHFICPFLIWPLSIYGPTKSTQ